MGFQSYCGRVRRRFASLLLASWLPGASLTGCFLPPTTGNTCDVPVQTDPDKQFIIEFIYGSNSELQLAQIALQKSTNDQVRTFATLMITEHTIANDAIAPIASAHGLTLPTTSDPLRQALADHLSQLSGEDFDREYASNMVAEHAYLLTKFRDRAIRAVDPGVKAYATAGIPGVALDLQLAINMDTALGGDPGLSLAGP